MLLSTIIDLIKKIEHVWLMVSRDFTTKITMDGITTLDTGPSIGGQPNVSIPQVASKRTWVVKNSHLRENGRSSKYNLYKNFTSASNVRTSKIYCTHCAQHTIISNETTTKAFCNYCSRYGHISFEYPFKNASNPSKVAWVFKRTN